MTGEGNSETIRLRKADAGEKKWRRWGPYLSERQWGTVREDYSANGDAWSYLPHEAARSHAYRREEDGLGGFCDDRQNLCLCVVLWNGKDPILKERLFGLTNSEGNHGEDVKEIYYYLDATPTYSYARMLYKYAQAAYPYEWLVGENRRRGRQQPEFELIDTGLFDADTNTSTSRSNMPRPTSVTSCCGSPRPTVDRGLLVCTCCRRSGSATRGTGSRTRGMRAVGPGR